MSQLIGARGLYARFRAVQKAPAGMMRDLGLAAVRHQKLGAPVGHYLKVGMGGKITKRVGGNLRRTIHLESANAREAVTVASARYAAFVELGTSPHVIRPRRRKFLRFAAGGRVIFTKMVRHPGTRAQPYMVPGAKRALREQAGVKSIVDAWNSAA